MKGAKKGVTFCSAAVATGAGGDSRASLKACVVFLALRHQRRPEFLESSLKDHVRVRAASTAIDERELFAFGDALRPGDFSP